MMIRRVLSNMKIANKILASGVIMLLTVAAVGLVALRSFGVMDEAADHLESAGKRTEWIGSVGVRLLSYARNVEFLPLEMSGEQRRGFEAGADEDLRVLRALLADEARKASSERTRSSIEAMGHLLAEYDAHAVNIRRMSREAKFDEAGQLTFVAAPSVGKIREILQAMEQRTARRLQEAATSAHDAHHMARMMMIVVLLTGALLSVAAVGYIVTAYVTTPLANMTKAMLAVASGDTSTVVPSLGQKDELGQLGSALDTFRGNLLEQRRLMDEQAGAQATKERQAAAISSAVSDFQRSIGEVVTTVVSASVELEAAAGTLSQTASSTRTIAEQTSAASEQASGNVTAVATAVQELTASIGEIGRQVQNSSARALNAVEQLKTTDGRMANLLDSAGRIGEVVRLITAVAEQTNLLALNATIEAARAGEAGKGFAVVASEVKALAGQTARATDAIAQQIGSIQAATSEAANSIREIGKSIIEVSEIASAISMTADEQAKAAQLIARNVDDAAERTSSVAASVSQVSSGAVETGSAAAQVLSTSQELSQQGEALRMRVEVFLNQVRAA